MFKALQTIGRLVAGLVVVLMLSPAFGQAEKAADAPWQAAITGQLEALRAGNGAAALDFAGAEFKAAYPDPKLFYGSLASSGYEPLVHSRSHTFGAFTRIDDNTATQIVIVVGPDQHVYEALYQVGQEPDGWRIKGVVIRQQPAIAI